MEIDKGSLLAQVVEAAGIEVIWENPDQLPQLAGERLLAALGEQVDSEALLTYVVDRSAKQLREALSFQR